MGFHSLAPPIVQVILSWVQLSRCTQEKIHGACTAFENLTGEPSHLARSSYLFTFLLPYAMQRILYRHN